MPGPRAVLLVTLVTLASAGCLWGDTDTQPPTPTTTTPTAPDDGPPLVFGGRVRDALSGEPVADAQVRLDLAHVLPCRREGTIWTQYPVPIDEEGVFGPVEVPRPRSDDFAFFLHTTSPGHTEDVVLIAPYDAPPDIGNITVALHPATRVEGTAPSGTVIALDAPRFPRLAVANATGAFAFDDALTGERAYAAATATPQHGTLTPPATLAFEETPTGWRLEGVVKTTHGTGLAADVVAWNGTQLVSAARASETGVFLLPLEPAPASLRLDARTSDGRYAGSLALDLNGPPGTRQTILMRELC